MLISKLNLRSYSTFVQRIKSLQNAKSSGNFVEVQGWIQNIRKMKKNIFVDINDGSTCKKFQVVLRKDHEFHALGVGSTIKASGKISVAPNGDYELQADKIDVLGECPLLDGYPFTPKQSHPPDYAREYLHLRSRVDYMASIFRIRHKAMKLIHDFLDQKDFTNISTPVLTTNDCEGAGEVFTIKPDSKELLKEMHRPSVALEDSYFDEKVFLTVSGQLHLEAMTYGLGNTYTFSPAFRAENSKSPLHLAEFYMLELELAFIEDLSSLADFIETMLKSVTRNLLDASGEDIDNVEKKLNLKRNTAWIDKAWNRLTFDEAFEILEKNKTHLSTELRANAGFSKEQEFFLVQHCGSPVFVTDWPKCDKPFYMKQNEEDPTKVHALDLLMPDIGELVGGSLRENNLDKLKVVAPEGMEWYLETRKFGAIPTGGFGLGFERYLQLVTGVRNIRDVIPYPRHPHSCKM